MKKIVIKTLEKIGDTVGKIHRFVREKQHERVSFMIVPHSEKKMVNIQFSQLTIGLVFIVLGVSALISGSMFIAYIVREGETARQEKKIKEYQLVKQEIRKIKESMKNLEPYLKETTQSVAPNLKVDFPFPGVGGRSDEKFQSSMFRRFSREYYLLKQFSTNLDYQTEVIKAMNKYLHKRQEVINDTPSLWPVEKNSGYITSRFGPRFDPFTQKVGFHKGIDIACFPGKQILATAPGKVVYAGYSGAYGLKVMIRHKYGFQTVYAHNRRLLVRAGQKVQKGDPVALAGRTGRATGVHLHYEVRIGSQVVNPRPYLLLNTY
jgi:murein DD-endopeptidase MepM/ murein hydrolase activator NlpD